MQVKLCLLFWTRTFDLDSKVRPTVLPFLPNRSYQENTTLALNRILPMKLADSSAREWSSKSWAKTNSLLGNLMLWKLDTLPYTYLNDDHENICLKSPKCNDISHFIAHSNNSGSIVSKTMGLISWSWSILGPLKLTPANIFLKSGLDDERISEWHWNSCKSVHNLWLQIQPNSYLVASVVTSNQERAVRQIAGLEELQQICVPVIAQSGLIICWRKTHLYLRVKKYMLKLEVCWKI